ncbi:unnamed protein product [Caenorhabditis nigoni]
MAATTTVIADMNTPTLSAVQITQRSLPEPDDYGEMRIDAHSWNQNRENNDAADTTDNNAIDAEEMPDRDQNHPEGFTILKDYSILDNNDNNGTFDRVFIAVESIHNDQEQSEIQKEPPRTLNNSNESQCLTSNQDEEGILEDVAIIAAAQF